MKDGKSISETIWIQREKRQRKERGDMCLTFVLVKWEKLADFK